MNQQHNNMSTNNKSNNEVVVSVKNISKKFCKHLRRSMAYGIADLSKNLIGIKPNSNELRKDEFWAVDNVSFDLRRGETLGLIGVNGSGKTTLLRLLAGIFPPDRGEISIKGKVGALIAIGAGFHPHMTGRENIFLNGTILGMTREEIDSKFQDIIDFAEIVDFLDAPVSTFSSGMRVRLGFAIAAQIDPDILIIDEVFAVGDVGFQAKCFNRMNEISKNAAVIFVSHSMTQVARIASNIMVINSGKSIFQSNNVPLGIERYLDLIESETMIVSGSGKVQLHDVKLFSDEGNKQVQVPKIRYSEDLFIELEFALDKKIKRFAINLSFFDKELRVVAQCLSMIGGHEFINNAEVLNIKVCIPKIPLGPGNYTLTIGFREIVLEGGWGEVLARYQAVREFRMIGYSVFGHAPVLLDGKWEA